MFHIKNSYFKKKKKTVNRYDIINSYENFNIINTK